jgi:hypothetical protein
MCGPLEKPHARMAKLGAILGDKVIRNWKWLQTTIVRADRAREDRPRHLTRGSTYRL